MTFLFGVLSVFFTRAFARAARLTLWRRLKKFKFYPLHFYHKMSGSIHPDFSVSYWGWLEGSFQLSALPLIQDGGSVAPGRCAGHLGFCFHWFSHQCLGRLVWFFGGSLGVTGGRFWWPAPPLIQHGRYGSHLGFYFRRLFFPSLISTLSLLGLNILVNVCTETSIVLKVIDWLVRIFLFLLAYLLNQFRNKYFFL
jgi:hypothetical protein